MSRLGKKGGKIHVRILWAIDHCSLVGPIILTASKFESTSWRCDGINILGVSNACFDDKNGHVGIFSKATGYDTASSAT